MAHLDERTRTRLTDVVNATGVLIHTNLGRVPLGEEQAEAVRRVAMNYSNLEYDLEQGRRGDRYAHSRAGLESLLEAQAVVVVNNNAAAVLVTLAALGGGGEVVISRGELIEIGGEFRMPDVMSLSGVRLVEVGTTNRTHLADYERAIGADTKALLKVHPSNYRVVGFTTSPSVRDLVRLAHGRGLPLLYDAGSGLVDRDVDPGWVAQEPVIQQTLSEGADVVTFSGDKLLGGPQAGIIAGRKDLVDRIAKHPLMRAVRPDKMTLAALQATVELYLAGRKDELPLWKMATASDESLRARAEAAVTRIGGELPEGVKVEPVATAAVAGGGSLPGTEIGSWAIAATHPERSPDDLAARLRAGSPPVIARIEDDRVLLDLRSVDPALDHIVVRSVIDALR